MYDQTWKDFARYMSEKKVREEVVEETAAKCLTTIPEISKGSGV